MQIQINTDHNIEGREALAAHVSGVVQSAVGRFSDHVTRVEVHLTDEVGHKSGQNDKRCVMEARLQGRQPIAVTHHAASLHQAVDGAADKLTRLVEGTVGRLRDQESRATSPSHQEPQTPEE
ncbi:MAG: HPF/RaiA family ribosome-associated protein [Burkholderiales bacterium]|nr:HPF/RaiA family ribosome-associated protein [Burkholderiales bacterium]